MGVYGRKWGWYDLVLKQDDDSRRFEIQVDDSWTHWNGWTWTNDGWEPQNSYRPNSWWIVVDPRMGDFETRMGTAQIVEGGLRVANKVLSNAYKALPWILLHELGHAAGYVYNADAQVARRSAKDLCYRQYSNKEERHNIGAVLVRENLLDEDVKQDILDWNLNSFFLCRIEKKEFLQTFVILNDKEFSNIDKWLEEDPGIYVMKDWLYLTVKDIEEIPHTLFRFSENMGRYAWSQRSRSYRSSQTEASFRLGHLEESRQFQLTHNDYFEKLRWDWERAYDDV